MDSAVFFVAAVVLATPLLVLVYVIVQHLITHRSQPQDEPFEIRWRSGTRRFVQPDKGALGSPIAVAERYPELRRSDYKRGFGIGSEAWTLSAIAFVVAPFAGGFAKTLWDKGYYLPSAVLSLAAVLGPLLCGRAALRAAKDHREAMQLRAELLDGDFVLYFRPFTFDFASSVDDFELSTGSGAGYPVNITFEESLSATCLQWRLGVRAIGRKYDGVFGPKSIETSNKTWMQDAERLMELARLIVVIPASSKGSFWELQRIATSPGLMIKTVWIMPPKRIAPEFESDRDWGPVAKRCSAELGLPFPQYHKDGAIFCFNLRADAQIAVTVRRYSLNLLAGILAAVRPGRVNQIEAAPNLA
ncbi:MAG TPA: hypothetical protein VGO52_20890 [Hyphomonadaceae bacterium]|jgi:hypothetical protein|nr:hypothetical protein [Hyphomonadaceae bacterium]